jgi:crotonobetainyl-CoA:carnitine CoA-transferase CaiB-like acyl-CoA transferase
MGDYVRWARRTYEGAEQQRGSALFLALNRNKRSIRINLKTDAGREVLLRLAREHDVVLESFRPACSTGSASATSAAEENPGLVYCAITGYGQDGRTATARATT